MTTKIQSRDVRDTLLSLMPEAIERLINYASGFDVKEDGSRGDFNGEIDASILLQLTNKAVPMIDIEDDKDSIAELTRAKTIDELLTLRNEGHISDKQLNQYTKILETNYEITELSGLLEKLEELEG